MTAGRPYDRPEASANIILEAINIAATLLRSMSRRQDVFSDDTTARTCHSDLLSTDRSGGLRCRSHSLNDIDCLRIPSRPIEESARKSSSSSGVVLAATARAAFYPLSPCHTVPARSPTPPGIPSFGTIEAEQLRLIPPSRISRFIDAIQRSLVPQSVNEGPTTGHRQGELQQEQRTLADPIDHARLNAPAEMLRRAMGHIRPTTVPEETASPRRASLPRGVTRSFLLGPLTQADDGSHVRGRFGPRMSGHGIGSRAIDTHPLSQQRGSSNFHDAIQEIEKACGREEQLRRSAAITSAIPPSDTHTYVPVSSPEPAGLENDLARHARKSERRATRAFEAQQRENERLRTVLRELQSMTNSAVPSLPCTTHVKAANSEYRTAQDFRRTESTTCDYGASDERFSLTSPCVDADNAIDQGAGKENGPFWELTEPALYSSYSSYSYTTSPDPILPVLSPPKQSRTCESVSTMIEQQNQQASYRSAHCSEPQQQQQEEAQKDKLELC